MRRLSWKKMMVLTILLILIVLGGFRVKALASSASAQGNREYVSVQIHSGDTLWSIAEAYCGSSDARDIQNYVNELKSMNHILNDASLKPGAYVMVYTVTR